VTRQLWLRQLLLNQLYSWQRFERAGRAVQHYRAPRLQLLISASLNRTRLIFIADLSFSELKRTREPESQSAGEPESQRVRDSRWASLPQVVLPMRPACGLLFAPAKVAEEGSTPIGCRHRSTYRSTRLSFWSPRCRCRGTLVEARHCSSSRSTDSTNDSTRPRTDRV
jgi:hypothetical protein